jgi:hypothetical protein
MQPRHETPALALRLYSPPIRRFCRLVIHLTAPRFRSSGPTTGRHGTSQSVSSLPARNDALPSKPGSLAGCRRDPGSQSPLNGKLERTRLPKPRSYLRSAPLQPGISPRCGGGNGRWQTEFSVSGVIARPFGHAGPIAFNDFTKIDTILRIGCHRSPMWARGTYGFPRLDGNDSAAGSQTASRSLREVQRLAHRERFRLRRAQPMPHSRSLQ